MALRITPQHHEIETVLHLAGKLDGESVDLLDAVVADAQDRIVLDMSEVRFADEAGIEMLVRLRTTGMEIRNPRPLIRLLLEQSQEATPTVETA